MRLTRQAEERYGITDVETREKLHTAAARIDLIARASSYPFMAKARIRANRREIKRRLFAQAADAVGMNPILIWVFKTLLAWAISWLIERLIDEWLDR